MAVVIDLRLGMWEEALADVEEVDCIITDPPYSERTHSGHNVGVELERRCDGHVTRPVAYHALSPQKVFFFVDFWLQRCRGWFVALTDHELAPHFESAIKERDWYCFAPLPFVSPGSRVRLAGDGPSCWTTWIIVARPRTREMASWGTLPGAYRFPPERGMVVAGGKPLSLMRALVRDYSRPGQTICDPCAGGGTTLLAAAIEGRRAIGAEMDPETHAKAVQRIEAGYTPDMFSGVAERELEGVQGDLL